MLRSLAEEHVEILMRLVDQESAQHHEAAYRQAWLRLNEGVASLAQPHPFAELASAWTWLGRLETIGDDAQRRVYLTELIGPFFAWLDHHARETTLFAIELYERNGNPDDRPYVRFFEQLERMKQISVYKAVELILRKEGKDVVRHEWGKYLGGGLLEFRIRHTADEIERIAGVRIGPATDDIENDGSIAVRVYFHPFGVRRLLLLSGHDKGTDPNGEDDAIKEARRHLSEWTLRGRRKVRG